MNIKYRKLVDIMYNIKCTTRQEPGGAVGRTGVSLLKSHHRPLQILHYKSLPTGLHSMLGIDKVN